MNFLQNHIESIIFCATDPVKPDEIRQCMSEMFEAEVQLEDIEAALDALLEKYMAETYPFYHRVVADLASPQLIGADNLAKHGLWGLFRSLALLLAEYRINVNGIGKRSPAITPNQ